MRIAYICIAFIISINTFGQITNTEKPIIDVTGTAELEISPDEIHIDLCLEEYMESGKKITLNILETNLKNELANAEIPVSNLYISDVNSVIAKTGWFTKETLSTGNYTLKVTQVAKIKEVFKIFEKLKITNANITKATHSQIVVLRKNNRIKAIKAAKEKANYLLNAIGAKAGKPLKVEEITENQQNFSNINYARNTNSYNISSLSKTKRESKGIVQFENIKITSSIHVIFEIQ